MASGGGAALPPPRLSPPLLSVSGLGVVIDRGPVEVRPVDGVDLTIAEGETFALLGESGCGKSMTALALTRLLPDSGRIERGEVRLHGEDLLRLPESAMRSVRGGRIGMIFQEPSTSLNPVMTVGAQIVEALARHGTGGARAEEEACRLLEAVGISDPARRLRDFPFQFSGGMKQRVMIAMALAGQPQLLVADEPTTALDVTIQAQVLDLLAKIQAERGMGMLLITHDLGVVARMAHRVGVMYAGELVETGPREAFFRAPLHPYARKLFAALPGAGRRGAPLDAPNGAVPALDRDFPGCRFAERCALAFDRCDDEAPVWHRIGDQAVRCHLYEGVTTLHPQPAGMPAEAVTQRTRGAAPVLEVKGLSVHFPVRKGLLRRTVGHVRAVDGVSLSLVPGRTLALVGESGCGKTTVGKAALKLIEPTAGELFLDGENISAYRGEALRGMRRVVQMVFQDPFASLNPRMRVGDIIEEGMVSLGVEPDPRARRARIDELLERVGLSADMRWRHPHEFSGGQRQRIAMARALAVSPRVIVCDEPTSALDVSVQAQLLNLMRELQAERGLAYLFITHNLAVVEYLADEVAVMYLGRIVEQGPVGKVLRAPAHPYTRALLAAVPRIGGEQAVVAAEEGAVAASDLPSPLNPPAGCHFHPRCAHATDVCRVSYPPVAEFGQGHRFRCHWPRLGD
ncbi:oligopeptide/dipeptide ABC transporter ATPase [Thauera linaloolentis 47Lol = DSM 12138]|uniref:Oligopeptide/dipeptide ABC transporter ATPase n=1 Tax=Thauera linaloolentis (strain DSM 12138 / JCM 21573 / CCUG 41526 / CIP 105981 / IAM 15112 / NBRC 102519 / 47Lol) TaxID=1123367 RepID=N6XSE6_THAL4|nr:oligopeptide/dipeptide ABC transporter ATPase [Thauera linaloolentis 47Lol = DSM 12138]